MSVDLTTGDISDALTDDEYADLEALETTISKGLDTFVEVGNALAEIRDRKLYRQYHATFDAYCREQWEIGRSRAYQLINAATVVNEMSTMVDTPQPGNERQAREIGKVDADERADVMREAAERGGGTATERTIREVREEREQVKDPMPDLIDDKRENDPEIHAAHVVGKFSDALVGFLNPARKILPDDVAACVPTGRDGDRIERLVTEVENWLNAYRDAPRIRRVK